MLILKPADAETGKEGQDQILTRNVADNKNKSYLTVGSVAKDHRHRGMLDIWGYDVPPNVF